jgi:hypothetical protein
MDDQIQIEDVLAEMRTTIAALAQEAAILRATIAHLRRELGTKS